LAGQRSIAVAVPELIKATRDAEAATRAAATRALGQTVGPADLGALTGLMAQAQSADEVSAVEAALESACTRIPDKAACAEQLLASLPASAAPARCSTLRLLGVTGTPKALEGVRAALKNDADGAVRDTAFRVLADWPDASALASLLDVFRTTQDETRRTLALRNSVRLLRLGEHSGPSTVGTYRELMAGARSVDDRKMILAGLSGVADPAALKLVEPLLSEASVQAEAEVAALSIARGLMGSSPAEAKAAASKLQAESKTPATRDRAAQIVRQIEQMEDYLTAWQVSGPYTEAATGATLFATAFPPEQPEAKAACAWRLLPAGTQPSRPWMLDLRAALSGERRVGYARTWVYSERAQAARIEFGTDDGHKLWLNGALIAQADRGGAAVPGDFKSSVQLRQGWNELLLKVIQDTGPWEFCLRLRTAAGDKLEGLRIRPVPPG
jgi:HEAT repeat protein